MTVKKKKEDNNNNSNNISVFNVTCYLTLQHQLNQ